MTGIIVGVDGSPNAALALQWAVAEGRLRDLPVTAVLAWGHLTQHQAVVGPSFDPAYDREAAATALKTYVHEALAVDDFDRVRQAVVNDLSTRALLSLAEEADLLVVGSRGLGGFRTLLLGSVSSQCLHHARCPVAVVHEGWVQRRGQSPRRVVVGIDGSGGSAAALSWAAEEVRVGGGRLELVHAWEIPGALSYAYTGIGLDAAPFEEAATRVLDEAVAEVGGDLEHPPERFLVQGAPTRALLAHSAGADLLVVGSRGAGGFEGLLLGSVSIQITRHADCPVVVVPTGR